MSGDDAVGEALPSEREFIVFRGPQDKQDPNRDTRGVTILPIAAARHYIVDAPVTNHVYVAHPSNPKRLYLFSQYDEQVLLDIFNEGLRLVQTLGACHVESWTHKTSAQSGGGKLKMPVRAAAEPVVTTGFNFEKSRDWEVVFTTTGQGSRPVDPRPLGYPDFPGFEATCEAVLRNGASKTQLTIQQEAKFLLNGEIAATLKGAGFKLGASATASRQTVYVIRAEFPKREGSAGRGLLAWGNR